jgi:hypothetical protein
MGSKLRNCSSFKVSIVYIEINKSESNEDT